MRPVADAGPVISGMAEAAVKANQEVVSKAATVLWGIVESNGRRYHIKGRGGGRVPLGARKDIKVFSGQPTGAVRGVPKGFWHIVEYGSRPHLIVGRKGKRRGTAAMLRQFEDGTLGGMSNPLKIGTGYAQFAHHPGHGTIGRPWAEAMFAGQQPVADVLETEQFKALAKAFLR